MHVWALGLSCEAPAALGPLVLHTKLKTRTFERPGASNTTKVPREDPPEREERMKVPTGERKKSAIFWAPPPFGAPHFGPK